MRDGSLKSLLESQARHTDDKTVETLVNCICGEVPTKYIVNVQDGPANIPTPNYECKHCKIDPSRESCDYPGEWEKAAKAWNVFINRIKDRSETIESEMVELQENGIIRNSKGNIIGRVQNEEATKRGIKRLDSLSNKYMNFKDMPDREGKTMNIDGDLYALVDDVYDTMSEILEELLKLKQENQILIEELADARRNK